MPRRNRNASQESRFHTTDADYGFSGEQQLERGTCPDPDCQAAFAADDKSDLDAAIQDHLDNAHGKPARKRARKASK